MQADIGDPVHIVWGEKSGRQHSRGGTGYLKTVVNPFGLHGNVVSQVLAVLVEHEFSADRIWSSIRGAAHRVQDGWEPRGSAEAAYVGFRLSAGRLEPQPAVRAFQHGDRAQPGAANDIKTAIPAKSSIVPPLKLEELSIIEEDLRYAAADLAHLRIRVVGKDDLSSGIPAAAPAGDNPSRGDPWIEATVTDLVAEEYPGWRSRSALVPGRAGTEGLERLMYVGYRRSLKNGQQISGF